MTSTRLSWISTPLVYVSDAWGDQAVATVPSSSWICAHHTSAYSPKLLLYSVIFTSESSPVLNVYAKRS